MPEQHPRRLCDLPIGVLEDILPVFESHYRAPMLIDPSMLSDEKGRIQLATALGKHSVVTDIRQAIQQSRSEVNKPKVVEEVI